MALTATASAMLSSKAFGAALPSQTRGFSVRINQSKAAPLSVRCNAEPEAKEPIATSATPVSPPQEKTASPPAVKKDFGSIMAFDGPAPETINGRLAMLGFTSALAVELANHHQITTQLGDPASISWFATTVALISVASLIPLSKGVSAKDKSSGLWSATAETLNGRVAMIGLVSLVLTEYLKGASLV
jgi:hypothetical protein